MIIGSLPFLVIAQTSINNIFATIQDHQVRIFLLILFVSIFIIYIFAEIYIDGNVFKKSPRFLLILFQ
jgi:Trk-type K+ transport system membrane component